MNVFSQIEEKFRKNGGKFFVSYGCVLVGCVLVNIVVDMLVPMYGWWMLIRSVLVVPTFWAFFNVEYGCALMLHDKRVRENPEWVSYRLRSSLSDRRKIGIIAFAFIVVAVFASHKGFLYTTVSGLWLSGLCAIIAYVRPTEVERAREEAGVPDVKKRS